MQIISEKILQKLILEDIETFMKEFGNSFCFIGSEYKIRMGVQFNYIDLLLFNIEYNLALPLSSITLVLIAAILTALSIYNDLGQIFGAGLFIPITGFSNSMVSASIEGKSEGLIYGIGTTLFSLSGSVICYGIGSSIAISLVYYVLLLMGVKI